MTTTVASVNDGGEPGPARRRRRLVAGLVAGIVVIAGVGGGLWLRGGGGEDLVPAHAELSYAMTLEPEDKATFVLSGLYIEQPGKDVKILDVKALTSPNLEYLGAFTTWPRDFPTDRINVAPGFPPPELKFRHPAIGVTVPAAETALVPKTFDKPPPLTVTVGFRLTSGDLGAVNGVRVTYKLDGRTKHEIFHQALIVCAAPRTCRVPKGGSVSDFQESALRQFGLLPKD